MSVMDNQYFQEGAKTAVKWVIIMTFVTVYVILGFFLFRKIFSVAEPGKAPHYTYTSGVSDVQYNPGELNELITEINNLLANRPGSNKSDSPK